MRITKEQVVGALNLMGLEFPGCRNRHDDARRQSGARQLRGAAQGGRADRYRAGLRLPPRPARSPAHQGAAALRNHHRQDPRDEGAREPGGPGLLARGGPGAAGQIARRLFHRSHQNVPGAHAKVLAQAALPDHAHRRVGAGAGRRRRQGDPRRTLSRPAARHPVRTQGSVRYQGHSDHLRRRALSDAHRR